ncbi:hypothetical protein F3Y22_tig00110998pilonHSYRG00093 [Hibiscus syriacus]|uniref:Uncharacterized protein n=1 Tax=Hibiscus syriacus TaxID=106335 RepID=A0A6A2Z962_HIBSY|nr:hypothetical protein F3Y22_tig00110998pilonHSYRG00093 [Hibiscus syriacus]
MEVINRYIAIKNHVNDAPQYSDFKLKSSPLTLSMDPGSDKVIVQNLYVSIDPFQLNRMKSYSSSQESSENAVANSPLLRVSFPSPVNPSFNSDLLVVQTSDRRAETTIVFVVNRGTKPLKPFIVNRLRSSLISVGSIVGNNSISIGFSSIHDDRVIRLRHLPHHRVPCIVSSPAVSSLVSVDGGA